MKYLIRKLKKYKKFVEENKEIIDLIAKHGCHKEHCGDDICNGERCIIATIDECIVD